MITLCVIEAVGASPDRAFFAYHYWPPGDTTIAVVGDHSGVEVGIIEREGSELDNRRHDRVSSAGLILLANS
jgi:hypothetical protein